MAHRLDIVQWTIHHHHHSKLCRAGQLGAKYHQNVTMIPKVFVVVEIMLSIIGRYGGHQFGHWAGQLGDGRAHLLGAVAIIIIVFCQLYDCQHH